MDHYPGPGGLASHWDGLDPAVEQAFSVHELLEAKRSRPAVSAWTVGLTGYGNVARAGALQVIYDLSHASGPDADDAAQA